MEPTKKEMEEFRDAWEEYAAKELRDDPDDWYGDNWQQPDVMQVCKKP